MIRNYPVVSADEILAWDAILQSEGLVGYQDALNDTSVLVSLEDAGLEETKIAPRFGDSSGVCENISWWSDGEDSRYESN